MKYLNTHAQPQPLALPHPPDLGGKVDILKRVRGLLGISIDVVLELALLSVPTIRILSGKPCMNTSTLQDVSEPLYTLCSFLFFYNRVKGCSNNQLKRVSQFQQTLPLRLISESGEKAII